MRGYLAMLLCCVLGASFLYGCDQAAPASTTPTTSISTIPPSTPALYRPSINITRADYNQAVALWQSHGITAYEVTVNELSLRSSNNTETFRVEGNTVTVLGMFGSAPTPVTVSRSDLEAIDADNTVEGLFDKVADALSYAEQVTGEDLQMVFEIRFDPTFGYVSYFMTDCEERKTPQAGDWDYACGTDTLMRLRTSNFKVLNRSSTQVADIPTGLPTSEP